MRSAVAALDSAKQKAGVAVLRLFPHGRYAAFPIRQINGPEKMAEAGVRCSSSLTVLEDTGASGRRFPSEQARITLSRCATPCKASRWLASGVLAAWVDMLPDVALSRQEKQGSPQDFSGCCRSLEKERIRS